MPTQSFLPLIAQLLRKPQTLLTAPNGVDSRSHIAAIAPRLLAITVVFAGLFGLVVGSYRGGIQYIYASLKMPLLFLVPVLVGLPAVRALFRAVGSDAPRHRTALAALVGMARTAILAAACAPVLWLAYSVHIDYHAAILLMTGCLLLVGLPGLATLVHALPGGGPRRWLARTGTVAILGVLLAQSGWVMRPFVVRPRADVTLFRPIEANVFSSLRASYDASRGRYRGWHARRAGLLGRALEAPSADDKPTR